MEENNVTTTETVDNTVTATEEQQTQETTEKVVPFDEHQRAMTGQYKAGIAAAMKEAGFEPDRSEDFKAQMEAFRSWQDSQKTEAQKAAEALQAAQDAAKNKDAEIAALNQKLVVLGKGVPAEKIDDYIALANVRLNNGSAETFEQALALALETAPTKPQTPPPYPAGTGTQPVMGVPEDEFQKRLQKYR